MASETGPVVVGVDGSEGSRRAVRWAAEYARLVGAPVRAVMAWDVPVSYGMPADYDDVDLEKQADAELSEVLNVTVGNDVHIERQVTRGHPAEVLTSASGQARLLVVGSHGHGRFAASLLGSVAHHCIQHAECPVLVMRGSPDR
jgi:nucleotide-binding universal stress UspA family protein